MSSLRHLTIIIGLLVHFIGSNARAQCDTWQPLLNGLNGSGQIRVLATYNGEMIAGGTFTSIGGQLATNIARWNGTVWSPLGAGTNGNVEALLVHQGFLYVAGSFTSAGGLAVSNIARWNGTSWESFTSGANAMIHSMTIYNNELVIGGEFTVVGGNGAVRIARWDGIQWHPFGTGITGPSIPRVYTLLPFEGDLIAGGIFSTAGGVTCEQIARWNGSTWAPMAGGFATAGSRVYSLLNYQGALYTAGITQFGFVLRWTGAAWSPIAPAGLGGPVLELAEHNGALVAGGNDLLGVGRPVAAYFGSGSWQTMGGVFANPPAPNEPYCFALHTFNGQLVAGGWFSSVAGITIRGIASLTECVGGCCMCGTCTDNVSAGLCQARGGVFSGNGIDCAGTTCAPQPSEPQFVLAPDGTFEDQFGRAVAISGDTMVIGADEDNLAGGFDQGSAYVYRWSGSNWTYEAKLQASFNDSSAYFGTSVAISGDTIAVGAPNEHNDVNPDWRGAAYVFVRSGATWSQQARLMVPNRNDLGNAVSIDGNTLVVGDQFHDFAGGSNQGAAFVFVRSGTTWTLQATLSAPGVPNGAWFGGSIALEGDTAVIGARSEDFGSNFGQGGAHVFVRSGTTWSHQGVLTAADGDINDEFGVRVDLSANTIVAGSNRAHPGPSAGPGAAYVFVRSGAAWSQQAKISPPPNTNFRGTVAIAGDIVAIGARNVTTFGEVLVFGRSGTTWSPLATLPQPNAASGDSFSDGLELRGEHVVAGAPLDEVGGNIYQGSATAFRLNCPRGACCINSFCAGIMSAVECGFAGGTYAGDHTTCPGACAPCQADITGDDMVDIDDLLAIIGAWGNCPAPCPPRCSADVDQDCAVNINDLLAVVGGWGPCR